MENEDKRTEPDNRTEPENKIIPIEPGKPVSVNEHVYEAVKLLGKGKGGYSWLVQDTSKKQYVLKQIHHEPCSYYSFGNKIDSEISAYIQLSSLNIHLPKLLMVDYEKERILKEYIEGPTIDQLTKNHQLKESHIAMVKNMTGILYPAGLNIDYYPTNFVLQGQNELFYIDYECNLYDSKWDFEHWGSEFWKNGWSVPEQSQN